MCDTPHLSCRVIDFLPMNPNTDMRTFWLDETSIEMLFAAALARTDQRILVFPTEFVVPVLTYSD